MKIGDIVNIKSQFSDYWKGKITEISDKWKHKLKSGEIQISPYIHPIATINEINGIGHAVKMECDLEYKNGEYWEK